MSRGWLWLGRGVLALVMLPLGYALWQLLLSLFGLEAAAWQAFFAQRGLWGSVQNALLVALVPTALALYTSLLLLVRSPQPPTWVAGLLAMPHVAFAIGVGFLLTPTGWLEQLLPWFSSPLADKSMALLIVTLWLKELPFVLLLTALAAQQLPLQQWRLVSTSLGYTAQHQVLLLAWPAILRSLRLPLMVVAVYGVAVVDVPLVSGPNIQAPLAVKVLEWQQQFRGQSQQFAIIGQWLLLGLSALVMSVVWLHERGLTALVSMRVRRGPAPGSVVGARVLSGLSRASGGMLWVTAGLTVLALLLLWVWSLTDRWPGSHSWPTSWTLSHWQWEAAYWGRAVGTAAWLAAASASLALVAIIILLEWQSRGRVWPQWWFLLPVLIPQLPLVAGWQLGISQLPAALSEAPGAAWVLAAHTLFALAYGYLMLSRHYLRLEPQWSWLGQSLGYTPNQVFWRVKLRLLAGPLVMTWAIAFSVSILQYVPTVILGGGRLVTITTEATAYGSGFERSLAALYALGQVALPLVILALAVVLNQRIKVERPMCS